MNTSIHTHSLEKLILDLLLLYVTILRWFNLTFIMNRVLGILIVLHILLNLSKYTANKTIFYISLVPVYLTINYILIGGSSEILFHNIIELFFPLLILLFLTNLTTYESTWFVEYLKGIYLPLNFFLVCNLLVSLLQMSGMYWLAGLTNSSNSLKADLISGLFGFNGMPIETIFCSFVLLYNFLYSRYFAEQKVKIVVSVLNLTFIILYSILFLFNDNKAFYFVFSIAILFYIVAAIYSKYRRQNVINRILNGLLHMLPILTLFGIMAIMLYLFSPIGIIIDKMLHEISIGFTLMNKVQGSNERIGMIAYLLSNPEQWPLGFGVGSYTWTTPGAFGFIHYGQSDFGTLLCLGGFSLILLIGILLAKVFANFFESNSLRTICVILFIILSIYTQIFTVSCALISAYFLACIIKLRCEDIIIGSKANV